MADSEPAFEFQENRLRNEGAKATPARSRRAAQNARTRLSILAEFEDALGVLGRIEAEAGPTLKVELDRAKRFQAAYETYGNRQAFIRRRLGQRSGLFRLMKQESGISLDRTDLYVEHMLRISANVAALTGSGWASVRTWLRSRLPMTESEMEKVETDFVAYSAEASNELARRIPSGDPSLHTGPTPADIAHAFGITTEQIRQANANTCGLTSIDPQDRKTRDRERKAAQRLKDGRKPQAQRTSKADMKALATRLGYSLAQIYRKRLDGTLDAFVAAHDQDETNVSVGIIEIDGGHFSLIDATETKTLQLEAKPEEVTVAETIMREGFTGRHLSVDPVEVERLSQKFPHLREGMLDHLAEVDRRMDSTPQTYGNRVRDNLLRYWNKEAGKVKAAA